VLGPPGNPVFEIARVDPGAPQSRCCSLAYLMAMHAIDDNRAPIGQFLPPALNQFGITPDRADDHAVIGGKDSLTANIDYDRRRSGAYRTVQVERGN
jgi:hypothetical protein